jgi:hypothetical protein
MLPWPKEQCIQTRWMPSAAHSRTSCEATCGWAINAFRYRGEVRIASVSLYGLRLWIDGKDLVSGGFKLLVDQDGSGASAAGDAGDGDASLHQKIACRFVESRHCGGAV